MTPNCYVYFLTSLVFTNNVLNVNAEKVLGEEFNEEFDFDGLPGAQHEFKVEVRAGTEECFYQHAKVGAKFHVSFEVSSGATSILFNSFQLGFNVHIQSKLL